MDSNELLRYRRLTMEDAWNMETELDKLKDLTVKAVMLRKTSWTAHCECVYFDTVKKVLGLVKLRHKPEKKTIADLIQKTRGNRHVIVFNLTGGGRIRIIAKNACFDRQKAIDKKEEWSQCGNGRYIGHCASPAESEMKA